MDDGRVPLCVGWGVAGSRRVRFEGWFLPWVRNARYEKLHAALARIPLTRHTQQSVVYIRLDADPFYQGGTWGPLGPAVF